VSRPDGSTAHPVRMPSVEVGMEAGRIVDLPVGLGSSVVVGQTLFVVEAEKVTMDIESPIAGRVVAILAAIGDEVAVGGDVLVLAADP
jgi:2-oxoisovalerate dehydrogenase E2 component (dihydrolipoyl transacylase)